MSYRYRRNRRREDHDVDGWLMTYADMITLILCFFAIFLSISVPKKDAFQQARAKLLEQFAADDPAGLMSPTITAGDAPPVQGSQNISPEVQRGLPTSKAPLTGFPSIVGNLSDMTGTGDQSGNTTKKPEQKPGDRISSIDMNSA